MPLNQNVASQTFYGFWPSNQKLAPKTNHNSGNPNILLKYLSMGPAHQISTSEPQLYLFSQGSCFYKEISFLALGGSTYIMEKNFINQIIVVWCPNQFAFYALLLKNVPELRFFRTLILTKSNYLKKRT